MNATTPFPDSAATDPSGDRDDWHEPMLRELAGIGMEMARGLLRRKAERGDDDVAGPDPQLAFARVSRAVRQIVALSAHLRRPPQPVAAKTGVAPAHAAPIDPAMRERVVARMQTLCRKSEMAGRLAAEIDMEAPRCDRERLLSDLDVRLDLVANTIDFLARPVDEVIAEIRHDLGLAPKPVADDEDDDWDEDEPGGDAEASPHRQGSG